MTKGQKLKVGLVFDDTLDSNDGVAQYVKVLGAWLSRQGHDVSYLVGETKLTTWEGGNIYSLAKNQSVKFNGNRLSMPLPGARLKIKRFLGNKEYDILHVMMPYSPFMAANIIKYASPSTVVVGTFHIFPSGKLSTFGSKFLRVMLWRTLRRFDAIASVSSAAAGFAKSAFHINSDVISNPVDIKKFHSKKTKIDEDNILFFGRLVKRKGTAELIRAFALLHKSRPQTRLVIAGAGPDLKKLQNLVRRLGLSRAAEFTGYVKEEDKANLLGSAAIACFPSLYGESFGIVLVEAMASGARIVLGGNNPGYSSVLGAQSKLLINPSDTSAFAARLNELLTNANLKQKLTNWQKQQVKKYDIDIVGPQIEKLYDSAIARQNKKSHNKTYE